MKSFDENIQEVVSRTVEINGFFLIDLIIRGNEQNRVFEVFIDGEKDVSAADCAKVSREIDDELKILMVKHPNYRLDVSSPGIDRPLKFLAQYPKHINRKFDITFMSDDDTKKLNGKLIAVNGDYLTFVSNNKEVIVNFKNITKANVIVSFS